MPVCKGLEHNDTRTLSITIKKLVSVYICGETNGLGLLCITYYVM